MLVVRSIDTVKMPAYWGVGEKGKVCSGTGAGRLSGRALLSCLSRSQGMAAIIHTVGHFGKCMRLRGVAGIQCHQRFQSEIK